MTKHASGVARYGAIFRLARRDLRGGLRGLRIFLACVAIGVAAIVSVSAISQSLLSTFGAQGRAMLGGDIALARSLRPLTEAERSYLSGLGRVSQIVTLRAMATAGADRIALVETKAVDAKYPLLGAVESGPQRPLPDLLAERGGAYGALADQALIDRLSLHVGDTFRLADGLFELRGELLSEPDRIATGIGFGPRVMISLAGLDASGLRKSATLMRWYARIALSRGEVASDSQVQRLAASVLKKFPNSGWDARTRANVSPQLSRNIARFTQFMSLIGIVSLIVGGVGVSAAVAAFVDRKRESIAILKAVGAGGGTIFLLILVEMAAIAVLGAAVGAAVGAAAPYILALLAGPLLSLPFTPVLSGSAIATGAAIGLLSALAFIIAPAGRAHDTPVAALFRLAAAVEPAPLRRIYAAGAGLALGALIALVYALAADKRIALMAVGAVFASAIVLRAVAWAISRLAGFGAGVRNLPLRLALGNIRRPGAVTRPVVTSLGLGLALLVTIVGVDGNVRHQLEAGQPGRTPDFFFADVQSSQAAAFRKLLETSRPDARIEQVPMLRGRIVRVGDRPTDQARAEANAAWVLDGDRGLTYATKPPEGSTVVAGQWWPADYKGPPLVSMDADIARGLGLKIGDGIAVNVMGRTIAAKIVNLRAVDWRSFGINFVLVFTPSTFAGAPHSELFSLASPPGGAPKSDDALAQEVAKAYPTVITLRVRDALQQALSLMEKLSVAIRAASAVTLATALLVLAGALAAGQRARLYDAVVLRMLGATRARLIGAYLIEFLILGAATSAFALLAGAAAARAIVVELMKLDFVFDWAAMTAIVAIGVATTVLLGLAGTWRTLGVKPARVLREL